MTPTIDELIEKLRAYDDAINGGKDLIINIGMCSDAMHDAASTLTSLQERNRKLAWVLRDLVTTPAICRVLGTNHTPNCDCPLCRARALLGDGA